MIRILSEGSVCLDPGLVDEDLVLASGRTVQRSYNRIDIRSGSGISLIDEVYNSVFFKNIIVKDELSANTALYNKEFKKVGFGATFMLVCIFL